MADEDPRGGLGTLFAPSSVAVYGASTDERKLGAVLLRNVADFGGRVVVVHPRESSVGGIAAVTSLAQAGPVDLALVSVPAPAVSRAVADAATGGARTTIVLSSGFGETGEDGRRVEAGLCRVARDAGMRLVGPNCMGVVSRLGDGRWLNGSYFWAVPKVPGPLSFISQSGAFGGMFLADLRRRGLGMTRFLSVGNAADVGVTEALAWLATDEATRVVGVFAEGITDGRRFVEVAREVTAHKPLVVLKAGKGRAGARAAASHTGSLAGSHAAVRAAFDRAGVTEAPDADAFFDTLATLAAPSTTVPRGRRVAVLTISGGPGVLAADAAERAGLELPPPGEGTVQRLRDLAPGFAALGNPVDLTPQCPPDSFPEAMRAVLDDPAYDGAVAINCGLDIAAFGEGLVTAQRASGKPVTAFVLDTPTIAATLADAGIPLLDSPERAVTAWAALAPRAGGGRP